MGKEKPVPLQCDHTKTTRAHLSLVALAASARVRLRLKKGACGEAVRPNSGHLSVQTTERYLGCKQRIRSAVNDRSGIEPTLELGARLWEVFRPSGRKTSPFRSAQVKGA